MSGSERQLVMGGAPGTGKTSFLGLLWLAILGDRAPGLKLANYQDDREYLNRIAGRLQSCVPALHTEVDEDRELALSLVYGEAEERVVLRIPDLSGETWRDATIERHWPERVEEEVSGSNGLLLFMHSQELDAGATIGEVNELAGLLEGEARAEPLATGGGTSLELPPADSSAAKPKPPTQVALVDALQLICEQRFGRPARVSLVVSAWDLVDHALAPQDFVDQNLPLLAQYLDTNSEWLQSRVFGLSAQGGDFRDDSSRALLAGTDPIDRALVRDAFGVEAGVQDIALWALGDS